MKQMKRAIEQADGSNEERATAKHTNAEMRGNEQETALSPFSHKKRARKEEFAESVCIIFLSGRESSARPLILCCMQVREREEGMMA